MRKVVFIMTLVIIFGLSSVVNALLINNSDGTITQIRTDGSKLMWLQNANYAKTSGFDPDGQLPYADAVTWAIGLTFAGHNDWRLPVTNKNFAGCGGYNSDSEMGDLYYNELGNTGGSFTNPGPFFNIMDYWYWTGTLFVDPCCVMVFSFLDIPTSPQNEAGWEDAGDRYCVNGTYAWLVRDVTPDPIPEPSTILLLFIGLIGIVGIKKKWNKDQL